MYNCLRNRNILISNTMKDNEIIGEILGIKLGTKDSFISFASTDTAESLSIGDYVRFTAIDFNAK